MKKFDLQFQQYEIDNILNSLRHAVSLEYGNCKWEWQEAQGMYYYTPNKRVKQLSFTIKSILRQMKTYEPTNL